MITVITCNLLEDELWSFVMTAVLLKGNPVLPLCLLHLAEVKMT